MRALVIWLASSALGALLVMLLPEDLILAGRLFSLSPGHGPSASDAIGIAILLGGWAWFVRATWMVWRIREKRWPGIAFSVLAALGLAACLVAIFSDRNMAATLFGAVAVAAQISLAIIPHRFAAKEAE